MKLHRSALKHGLAPEDFTQAAESPLWIEPLEADDWPRRELRLGFDTGARLLETIVFIFDDGDELVIQAMLAPKQYWQLLP